MKAISNESLTCISGGNAELAKLALAGGLKAAVSTTLLEVIRRGSYPYAETAYYMGTFYVLQGPMLEAVQHISSEVYDVVAPLITKK